MINKKLKMDGLRLLKGISNNTIKVIFFDPQYRGILDKMKYGNEGKSRGKERSLLPQMDEKTIHNFIKEIERVLVGSGYLFLWVDKFHLAEGLSGWFSDKMYIVDFITWNKQKIGMGYRTRRKSEYLVIVQKHPKKAKSTWSLHNIPDVWDEKLIKKTHTHEKPLELQKQLILATTNEDDVILDPAAGSFSVMKACFECNRNFLGCDLIYGEEDE